MVSRPVAANAVSGTGLLPGRNSQTGIGAVPVKAPRGGGWGDNGPKIRFSSNILSKYVRRTRSLAALSPRLYRSLSVKAYTQTLQTVSHHGRQGQVQALKVLSNLLTGCGSSSDFYPFYRKGVSSGQFPDGFMID